jgi:hypothetical protein
MAVRVPEEHNNRLAKEANKKKVVRDFRPVGSWRRRANRGAAYGIR